MSTTTPVTPTFTPTSTTGGGVSNQSSMQRGANYFFGFLITFVVLLLIFAGCGIGSRRRSARRRQLNGLDPWDMHGSSNQLLAEPKLWEPPIVVGGGDWSTLTPLAVMRRLHPAGAHSNDREQDDTTRSFTSSIHEHSLPSARMPWSLTPRGQDMNVQSTTIEPKVSQSLQVAVMISMPSMRKPHEKRDDDTLPEYQIGVAHLPWG
ncbi:hypothetical protein AX16_004413 [Volvariella volvacea WC 439]|nr:hypothetical protein AX16_004413 [Volvariella volvacea WC 439]